MADADSLILPPAQIRFGADGNAVSERFDDIYYRADGIEEVHRVFVEPGNIIATATTFPRISIAELGFGTGLNFVVTASAVLEQTSARLHFLSVEQFPLGFAQWQTLAAQRRSALPLYAELAGKAPPRLPGWHRRTFAEGRIVLSVYHGSVASGLEALVQRQRSTVDAWFLDGFAPDRNPKMWEPPLFGAMATCSHHGTRLATFTAASRVQKGLRAAGFTTETIDQRPYKRESLTGRYTGNRARTQPEPGRVTVHGAGLGGTWVARQLAEQGVETLLCDPQGIANGASGVPATLLHPRLLGDHSVTAEHRVNAYHHTLAALADLPAARNTGALQVCGPNLDSRKLERICAAYEAGSQDQHHWIERVTPREMLARGWPASTDDGLWFKGARVIRTRALCMALAQHPNIHFSRDVPIPDDDGVHVFCSGFAVKSYPEFNALELAVVHGQTDTLWQPSSRCAIPVVGDGYYLPDGTSCVIGATYEYTPWAARDATRHNLRNNEHYLHPGAIWTGRSRATRTVSSDRLPVIGQLRPSAWIATAFGSMGTSVAPFAACQVTSDLFGWIPPVSSALEKALSPARFASRQARRGRLEGWS